MAPKNGTRPHPAKVGGDPVASGSRATTPAERGEPVTVTSPVASPYVAASDNELPPGVAAFDYRKVCARLQIRVAQLAMEAAELGAALEDSEAARLDLVQQLQVAQGGVDSMAAKLAANRQEGVPSGDA